MLIGWAPFLEPIWLFLSLFFHNSIIVFYFCFYDGLHMMCERITIWIPLPLANAIVVPLYFVDVLKQVWDLSDQDNDGMLSLREFCIALYLMERNRAGTPLPPSLPDSLKFDETLLRATGLPSTAYNAPSWQPNQGNSCIGCQISVTWYNCSPSWTMHTVSSLLDLQLIRYLMLG